MSNVAKELVMVMAMVVMVLVMAMVMLTLVQLVLNWALTLAGCLHFLPW